MSTEAHEATLVANGFDPRYLKSKRFFFLEAFKKGELALAEAFLACGMPFRADGDREAPIVKAAEGGSFEAVELALEHSAALGWRDAVGDTAVHTAANWKHAELVRKLVAIGATLDTENDKGWTPLSKAVSDDDAAMVDLLLSLGASPSFGKTPPIWAAKTPAMLARLLRAGADPNVRVHPAPHDTLLTSRVAQGKHAEVELLLAHGARDDANDVGWTAWMTAKAAGDAALAKLLAAHGAAENGDWERPLHAATTAAEVRSALDAGAAIDAVDRLASTALVSASRKKNREVVRALLEAGADATLADATGRSALTYAAAAGDLETLELLLARGASPNESSTPDGRARSFALGHAAAKGELTIVERLIAAGAYLDSQDEHGQTAVSVAAARGHLAVLDALLRAGASPDLCRKMRPIRLAQGKGFVACVARLAAAGADLEHEELGDAMLASVASTYGAHPPALGEMAATLIAAGADLRHANSIGRTPFAAAILAKNAPVVAAFDAHLYVALLAKHTRAGADGAEEVDWRAAVAEMHEEHLRAFVRRGDRPAIQSLLDAGLEAQLASRGPSPVLFDAVAHPEIFELFLERGADPHVERSGHALVRHVASSGTVAQVARLIELGVDIESPSDSGETVLTSAGTLETTQLLVERGARVNPVRAGWTPLMRAAQAGRIDVVEYLLSVGADADIVAPNGASALSAARMCRDKAASKKLVRRLGKVTKPDMPDERGRTPLFNAAMRGDVDAVRTLLARGAKPKAKDRAGETPLSVAALRPEVAEVMGVAYAPLAIEKLPEEPPAFVALRRGEPLPEGTALDERNSRGDALLHVAVALGDLALLDRLALGSDMNAKNAVGHTPWSVAVPLHGMGLGDRLVAMGARIDVNAQVVTSSHYYDFRSAVRAGDLRDVWRRIRAREVDAHLVSRSETPLAWATRADDRLLVAQLLEAGADPLVPVQHRSVANVAIRLGAIDLATLLLDAGAPLDPWALQIAASHGHPAMMRFVVDRGAALDVMDEELDADALRLVIDLALERDAQELAARASRALRVAIEV